MAIAAHRKSGNGPIVPMEDGINQAVIVRVEELGVFTTQFGDKFKVAVEFADAEGRKASRIYNGDPVTKALSLHEKSNLAIDLKALGINVGEDVEDIAALLLGQQAVVIVEQYTNQKGYTNARVTKVVKPQKGQNVVPPTAGPEAGVAPAPAAKKSTRKASAPKATAAPAGDGTGITDADIPF